MSASIQPADGNTNRKISRSGNRIRIRNGAIGLGILAAAFYLGFIALLVFRSRH